MVTGASLKPFSLDFLSLTKVHKFKRMNGALTRLGSARFQPSSRGSDMDYNLCLAAIVLFFLHAVYFACTLSFMYTVPAARGRGVPAKVDTESAPFDAP